MHVHALALVESAQIGPDTRVWAFAHVMRGARIGARCNIGEGAFVESNVVMGDDVTVKNGVALWDGVVIEDEAFLGPCCVFTNDPRPRSGRYKRPASTFLPTRVARGASIGANATVICGHDVGPYAMVAAGTVVTANVPAHALVAGVPGRVIGFVCACGERLPVALRCDCGATYVRDGTGLRSRPPP